MKKAIFPGSFEIFHEGHFHILEKALKIFSFVYIVVANNKDKKSSNINQRKQNVEEFLKKKKISNYCVETCEGLLINFIKKVNIYFIIRGVRDTKDFLYEKKLLLSYKKFDNNIEVIYFFSNKQYLNVSSSNILKNKG